MRPRIARLAALATAAALPALAGCASAPPETVAILASTRADAPGAAWSVESANFRAAVDDALRPGNHVVILTVSDASSSEPTLLDVTVPPYSWTGLNPRQLADLRARDEREALGRLRELAYRRGRHGRTEIIAAVGAAADQLSATTAEHRKLIVLSTGFEQSAVINMADASQSVRAQTHPLIRRLARTGALPDLRDVDVCMAGVSSGLHGWADATQLRQIDAFWKAYFGASGARLVSFGPSLASRCLG